MVYINLVNPDHSGIDYKITNFSDGQKNISIDLKRNWAFDHSEGVRIVSRMSWEDLQIIICTVKALRREGVEKIQLYVPYFLGARSDRKFEGGSTHYLKDVICPIINSLELDKVTVMDPHSDVLEACLNNFDKSNNFDLVKFALTDIDNKNDAQDRIVLVSPDAGAFKKIFDVAKNFRIGKIITATKIRDIKTGKIIHTEIPVLDQHNDLKYVIIDDICDGGRTFIELAKAIHESRPTAEVYLVVTHGIFSAGFLELSKHCKRIYCTNSVKDIQSDSYSDYTVDKNFVKQFMIL